MINESLCATNFLSWYNLQVSPEVFFWWKIVKLDSTILLIFIEQEEFEILCFVFYRIWELDARVSKHPENQLQSIVYIVKQNKKVQVQSNLVVHK